MNIADFITELYCRIDDALPLMAPHPQARLSISELVTIGVLHATKNVKQRPFYHWLKGRKVWDRHSERHTLEALLVKSECTQSLITQRL